MTADILTGSALASLGSDGRFHVPPAVVSNTVPALSRLGAERIAVKYWRTFGMNHEVRLAERRGAPIDADRLSPCGTTILAESPFESPPLNELSHYRASIGPQWVVPFCNGSEAQVIVTVAALAAGLEPVTAFISSPRFMNAAISVEGVPPGTQLALTPEEAALAVATATRTRISSVPRLMRADPPWAPGWAMWEVELERPVNAVGSRSGSVRLHSVLLFGHLPAEGWRTAVAASPSSIAPDSSKEVTDDLSNLGRGIQQVVLRRRAAVGFSGAEAVRVIGGTAP